MKLENLNRWLTLAANMGVIAGIVFLGIEIKQNTDATRSSVEQSMMETDKDLMLFQAQAKYDQRLSSIEIRNPRMLDLLPGDFFYWAAFSRTRYHYWTQYQAGLLDEQTYRSYMASFIGGALGANPYARAVFLDLEPQFPKEFFDEINRLWGEAFPDRSIDSDLPSLGLPSL